MRLTSPKGDAEHLLEMIDSGKFHYPKLADSVEQASKEFRKNFKLKDVRL